MRSSNHYGLGLNQLSAMDNSFGGGGGRFCGNESFECNQSFPRALRTKQPQADLSDITHLRGCELSSVSFLKQTLVQKTKSSTNATNQRRAILLNDSSNFNNTSRVGNNLDKSWMFYNKLMLNQTSPNNQQSLYLNNDTDLVTVQQNPNKALITINGRTTEILTANNISCDLFGYSETDLLGKKLKDLLIEPDQDDVDDHRTKKALIETGKLDQNGRVVICSGRIMEAISASDTKTQQNMPVSIYMMKLTDEAEPKCLCVMEPIQRVSGSFGINFKGRVCYSSPTFSQIFGYTVSSSAHSQTPRGPSSLANLSSSTLLNGRDINDLLPAMKLPINGITPDLKRQLLTGRSLQGENIPVTVSILNKSLLNNEIVFNCHVAVYTNMSGLVIVRASDYKISSYNATFARLIFGYDDKDLLNKPVEYLIPNFFEPDTDIMAASRSAIQTSARRVSSSFYNLTRSGSRHHGSKLLLTNSSKRQSLNTTNGSKLKSLGQVPTFRITDHDDDEEDKLDTASINSTTRSATNPRSKFSQLVCAQCGKRFIKQMTSKKRSLDEEDEETSGCKRRGSSDLLEEINLMDNTEYSPNKKCVNYINANSFTPTRGSSGSSTMPTTPQSTVKKSLLAKAITKNATNAILNRDSFNFDDNSKLNNSSMMVDYSVTSSPTSSPSKMSTSTMGGSQDMDQQSSISSYVSDRASSISDFSSCGDLLQETATCEECKSNKYHQDQDEKSEVSLIMDQTNEIEMSEDVKSTTATTTKDVEEVEEEEEAPPVVKFKNITSTPYRPVPQHDNQIDDGLFFGKARHADSSQVKIFYQRKWMESGDLIYVWISRDPYSDMSMMDSLDQSRLAVLNASSQQDSILGSSVDAYSKEYENIHTIGRGVSGFVKLARRRLNNFPVVTKYIQKEKVYQENYVEDKRYGCVPLEISLLCKLEHKNIIRVLDVFQTSSYIQMVMEKHGCGMDLFEFIDRVQHKRPINEGLISHIFKQLVSAVSYLHSNQIVHRDIKDENIVIDEKFDIKLIDFGSAAYMSPDKKFGTFCGTMEYCSPEILLGNKYHGPELDVWTCGIVLYTLAFCENPFNNTEETIECVLKPPLKVSKELMKLLFAILCLDPTLRARIDQIERNEWVNQPVDMQAFKWEEVVDNTEFQTNDAGVEGHDEDVENCNNNKENRVIINREMLSKSF